MHRQTSGFFTFTAWRHIANWIVIALLWCFACMAIVGAWYNYSVVPYADAWQGYLGFYNHLPTAGWLSFWAQHNEHRIVVARLLFWLDLYFLQGKTPALVVLNYLFSLAVGLVFLKLADRLGLGFAKRSVFAFLLVPCFSLAQMQNLYLPFQGQFVLSYLFPLLSFYALGVFAADSGRQGWFWLACAWAIVSVGTMANGLLAWPVLVLLGMFLRIGWWRIGVIALLSALMFGLYLHGYQTGSTQVSVFAAFMADPLAFFRFFFLYMGSPFYYLFWGNIHLASAMGGGLVGLSIVFLLRTVRCKENLRFEWVMLAFLAFVGVGALISTVGRVSFGYEQAVASRYCTPVIWAWVALVMLAISPYIGFRISRKGMARGVLVLVAAFFPYQVSVLLKGEPEQLHFAMRAAALAMKLQILDTDVLGAVSPSPGRDLLALAREADALSTFTQRELQRARSYLGHKVNLDGVMPECRAVVNVFAAVSSDPSYRRLEGWIFNEVENTVPFDVIAVDGNDQVVGYAVVGKSRPDIIGGQGKATLHSGFFGYVRADVPPETIRLLGLEPNCRVASGWEAAFKQAAVPQQLQALNNEVDCQGSLDSLQVSEGKDARSVNIEGWVAGEVGIGKAPDELYLRIVSTAGTQFLSAALQPRSDVNAYFNQPKMGPVGFSMKVELPPRSGEYEFNLVRRYRDEWAICQNITRNLFLNKASGT